MSAFRVDGPSSFALVGRVLTREEEIARDAAKARRPRRRWTIPVAILLAALAVWQLGAAGYVQAKAALAQHLIAGAWASALKGESRQPWPWADTRPVARLTVPSRGVELFVLAGTSGRSLAFGPGHVDGTAMPGGSGNSVIVAHRDTHFAFLRDLDPQAEIAIEDAKGRVTRYRVREVAVVDKGDTRVLEAADSPQLTLITCWPFDAVAPGTPYRYVVIADRFA
ncbi:MAG: class GN sortase [Betaproteobacteria bacterium]|nr:class GN sortase [Betaproteobacteria bacterium]